LILKELSDPKEFRRLPKDMDWMVKRPWKISNMQEATQFSI